jgi:putative DNA primase/helicase
MAKVELNAGMERPETRKFDFDALEEAKADRAELVVAILTIIRAYVLAGCPPVEKCDEAFGSFEDWSRWVRHPLVWAGADDPVSSLTKIRSRDDDRTQLGTVLALLRTAFGEKSFNLADVVEKAVNPSALFDVLVDGRLAGNKERSALSRERLGRFFKKNAGRVVDKLLLFDDYDTHKKQPHYKVLPHEPLICGGLR